MKPPKKPVLKHRTARLLRAFESAAVAKANLLRINTDEYWRTVGDYQRAESELLSHLKTIEDNQKETP